MTNRESWFKERDSVELAKLLVRFLVKSGVGEENASYNCPCCPMSAECRDEEDKSLKKCWARLFLWLEKEAKG